MATTYPTHVRPENDTLDPRGMLLLAAYASAIIVTIGLATATAVVLATVTAGLGQFVLVAAGWLVLVSVSPEIARRTTLSLGDIEFGRRAPRTSRAVAAALTYVLVR